MAGIWPGAAIAIGGKWYFPELRWLIISAGLCLPSLLRPEKMPGYANKQGAPALSAFIILEFLPISHFRLFLRHQLMRRGHSYIGPNIGKKCYWVNPHVQNRSVVSISGVSKRELEPDLDYQKAFGEHLRKLRKQAGWTQVDLAVNSRVSEYQISIIENGHEGPNLQTIKAIAIALGKHPSQLLDFKYNLKLNTNFPKKRDPKPATTKLIQTLVGENFFKLPRSVKDVTEYCKGKFGTNLRSANTSGTLLLLVKKKKLKVSKSTDGKNLYQNIKK